MDIWVSTSSSNKFEEVHHVARAQRKVEEERRVSRMQMQQKKEFSRSHRRLPKELIAPTEEVMVTREFIKVVG